MTTQSPENGDACTILIGWHHNRQVQLLDGAILEGFLVPGRQPRPAQSLQVVGPKCENGAQ